MSKAGIKIIEGAKQALKVVECDHDWHIITADLDVEGNIRKIVDHCDFCGARRTRFTNTQGQSK